MILTRSDGAHLVIGTLHLLWRVAVEILQRLLSGRGVRILRDQPAAVPLKPADARQRHPCACACARWRSASAAHPPLSLLLAALRARSLVPQAANLDRHIVTIAARLRPRYAWTKNNM